MSNPEIINSGEIKVGNNEAASEQLERLKDSQEKGVEESPDQKAEKIENARSETKEALMNKERGGSEKKVGGEPTSTGIKKVTRREKDVEYKKTMNEVRSHMNAPSRAFSKVIHNPIIEKTSDFVGATVARPNAIISGSTFALVLVAVIYMIAKKYGYIMSGFETIGAFATGWVLGIIFDYFRIMISGGRRS